MNWLVIGLILLVIIIIITIIIFKPRTGGVEFIDKAVNANITMIKEWAEKKDKPLSEAVYTRFNSIYFIVKSYADQSDTNIERNCLLEICNHYNNEFEKYMSIAKKTFIKMTTLPMTTSLDERCIEYCTKIVGIAGTCIERTRITKFILENTKLKYDYEDVVEKVDEHGHYDLDNTVLELKDCANSINQISDLILINIERLLTIDERLDRLIQSKKPKIIPITKEITTSLSEIRIVGPTKEFIDSMNTSIEKCKSDFSMTTLNNVIREYTKLKLLLWNAELPYIFQLYLLEQYWEGPITLLKNDVHILENNIKCLIIGNEEMRIAIREYKINTPLNIELIKICEDASNKNDEDEWDLKDHFDLLEKVKSFEDCEVKKILLNDKIYKSKDDILQKLDLIVLSNEQQMQKFIDYQKEYIKMLYESHLGIYKSIKNIKDEEKYNIIDINYIINLFNAISNSSMIDNSKIESVRLSLEFYKKCIPLYVELLALIKRFIDSHIELFRDNNINNINTIDDLILFKTFDTIERYIDMVNIEDVKRQIFMILEDIIKYLDTKIYEIFEKIEDYSIKHELQIKYSKLKDKYKPNIKDCRKKIKQHILTDDSPIISYEMIINEFIEIFDHHNLLTLKQEFISIINIEDQIIIKLDELNECNSLSEVKEKIDSIESAEIRIIYQSFDSYNFRIPQYKTELKQITARLYPIIDEEIDKISKMSE